MINEVNCWVQGDYDIVRLVDKATLNYKAPQKEAVDVSCRKDPTLKFTSNWRQSTVNVYLCLVHFYARLLKGTGTAKNMGYHCPVQHLC